MLPSAYNHRIARGMYVDREDESKFFPPRKADGSAKEVGCSAPPMPSATSSKSTILTPTLASQSTSLKNVKKKTKKPAYQRLVQCFYDG